MGEIIQHIVSCTHAQKSLELSLRETGQKW